ncbi:hypothetical protein HDC94_002335 [Leifsonia sp. AK011]|uniref:hypothetical protein n=1 Tax=Leifsonia sp. AK011 TaxID=2723075 RepID=UPI0015C9A9A7|nr:hypothetical protein [Leifsonia sp. AK011]NYF11179.1 hypothetical protein [Leifsonia sp. AK011]
MDIDTETSRDLALLNECSGDLDEAVDALTRVIEIDEGEHPHGDAELRQHLISAGMIAYWRCYMTNERPNLGDLVETPTGMTETHHAARKFRNRAIAHADSATKRASVAVELIRDAGGITVGSLWPYTNTIECPTEFVAQMIELIEELQVQVHYKHLELRDLLASEIAGDRGQQLWDGPQMSVSPLAWTPVAKRERP